MIVAERKPLAQIEAMLADCRKILLVGCGTCTAVCLTGGEKEVELLAAELRMRAGLTGRERFVDEITLTRQCDKEYVEQLAPYVGDYDAVLSAACGAGVQLLAERFDDRPVLPALNTLFLGTAEGAGVWTERCSACADCLLDLTGGVCPVTRCAKGLLNGPCGGANHGKCETDETRDCAWTLIYRRLEKQGRLDLLREVRRPKNHAVLARPGRFHHPAFREADEEQ